MIIEEVKGNAVTMHLEGKGHLIHGCNCHCAMGKGIAKEVKNRIPMAYRVDQYTVRGDRNKLGTCSVWNENGVYVFNAYTQYNFNSKTPDVDYDAIAKCFENAVEFCKNKNSTLPIITPLIGAGLAGGDWVKIRAIIEEATDDYPVIVVHFG